MSKISPNFMKWAMASPTWQPWCKDTRAKSVLYYPNKRIPHGKLFSDTIGTIPVEILA